MNTCEWCGGPLPPPKPVGRPRVYCSIGCRRDAGHQREAEPALRAKLADLEASARTYRGKLPPFLINELAETRRRLERPA